MNDAPDFAAATARQQATWSEGDFSMVGAHILYTAERLAEALELMPGERVLDVACGSGNGAIAAARRSWVPVTGLDFVLEGGFACNRLHLLEGNPGSGKTTIALQFLMAGAAVGESGIYVSLAETEQELRDGARSHGWEIPRNIEIFELVPPESVLDPTQHQSLLYSSDLELGETTKRIFEAIERIKPKRVVIDSLSEIRLLAQSSLRYRRQILALKHYFAQHQSTVIMLDDLTNEIVDQAVHSNAHSVIHLDQLAPIYGGAAERVARSIEPLR